MSFTPPLRMIMLAGLLLGYFTLFTSYENQVSITTQHISPTLPIAVLKVVGHSYLKQLIAESLFIKTAVFYGGLNQAINNENLHIMAQHFLAMSQLHPNLLDLYYRSESILAHQGEIHANTTNQILKRGRTYLPQQIELPFFEGFNYFHYLNEPTKAANVLRIASDIDGAPKWIGHLASMLMASGGNIRTALIWLKGMHASTQDEGEKARYQQEIIAFEKAMQVELALNRYVKRVGSYPNSLNALLQSDLDSLPTWKEGFKLDYQAPKLFLRRNPHE